MGFFDEMAANMGGLDIDALAARVGLDPEQVRPLIGALMQKIGAEGKEPETATAEAAAETGHPPETIRALLPEVLQSVTGGGLGGILGGVGKGLFG